MKKYTAPEIKIVTFSVDDIITTSAVMTSGLAEDELGIVKVTKPN